MPSGGDADEEGPFRDRARRQARRTTVRVRTRLARTSNRRLLLGAIVLALMVPGVAAAVSPYTLELGPGTVTRPAEEPTYVGVQGFHHDDRGSEKKPARLVAADPDASARWTTDGDRLGASWFYDVDPVGEGDLLATTTSPGGTRVFRLDANDRSIDWQLSLPFDDTHDVDRLNDTHLVVANMRAYEDGVSNDRLAIVDRRTGDVEWTWRLRNHYPNGTDGGFKPDWSHLNDVDVVGPEDGYFLASPRNFDQVILVDRASGDVVMRLGRDDAHDVLFEQHNPDYLETDDGTPVILVADSENDRVVEYVRDCGDRDPALGAGTPPSACSWDRVWSVNGFNWPRDADRLPNGNTLVTDTLNHRVVEVAPNGTVVWEFHAAWGPYDAERGLHGSNGPTMVDRTVHGSFTVRGGEESGPAGRYTVGDAITDLGETTGLTLLSEGLGRRWSHVEPWIRPVWMDSWSALSTALGAMLALSWSAAELLVRRGTIAANLRRALKDAISR